MIKILVVEDSEENFIAVRKLLSQIQNLQFDLNWVQDYESTIAAIRSSVERASEPGYDLCLLKDQIGTNNGIRILKELGSELPIIFWAESADREVYYQVMESGATAFLSRDERTPFNLERTIHTAIRQKQTEISLQKTQQELARVQSKADYLYQLQTGLISSIAHEFRTHLNNIQAAAYLLWRASHLDEVRRERNLQRIQNEIHQLVQILDNTLLYASLESGKIIYHPAPLQLNSFCKNLVERLQKTAAKDQKIQLIIQDTVLPPINLDATLLQVTLTQLLLNAIRYSPHKEPITIEVQVEQTGVKTVKAVFRICDQGIGIPLEEQDKIFDAYYRASNADSVAGTPGIGLGLAVVKGAIKLQNGSITLSSRLGDGTVWMVSLVCSIVENQTFIG